MRAASLNLGAIRTFRRSGLVEQIVSLHAPDKQDALDYQIAATPCKVRLIRQVFGHKVRVLVTSLLAVDAYPAQEFGALDHSHWRIEELFRRIKHRLAPASSTNSSRISYRSGQTRGAEKITRIVRCDRPDDRLASTPRHVILLYNWMLFVLSRPSSSKSRTSIVLPDISRIPKLPLSPPIPGRAAPDAVSSQRPFKDLCFVELVL